MLKIKSLKLKNYAGFNNEVVFNFTHNDIFKPINMFYGPNGCGKSTALNAITLLSRAKAYVKRDKSENNLLLRKLQFHPDYDPNYAGFTKYTEDMEVLGTYTDGKQDYIVHIRDDDVVRNDLENRKSENSVFIDADNPLNLTKFQIPKERVEQFLQLARAIYGYDCYVEKPVASNGVEFNNTSIKEILSAYANRDTSDAAASVSTSNLTKKEIYEHLTHGVETDDYAFFQDFVLIKGDVKVHYKSMSAGEKKIATLLRSLCDPTVIDKSDIVLVDNIEMHVYFKRHKRMIDKILEVFPSKQFIVTSHSGIMIEHVGKSYGHHCLYDIPVYKGQILID